MPERLLTHMYYLNFHLPRVQKVISSISVVLIHEMGVFTSSNTSVGSGGLFMDMSLKLLAIVFNFTENILPIEFIPVTLSLTTEKGLLYARIVNYFFLAIFSSILYSKYSNRWLCTFDQLGIAKFCPKQEIVDFITTHKKWMSCE